MAIRDIARQLGCLRNTVKRYLKEANAARWGPQAARLTKLNPYQGYLLERVQAARPKPIPAAVLLREIEDLGYDGGVTQLKAFLEPHRQAKADDAVVRFGAPPRAILGKRALYHTDNDLLVGLV